MTTQNTTTTDSPEAASAKHTLDYMPDSIDNLIWLPYWDDDKWSQHWVGFGKENGEVVQCDCDIDGNWDYEGSDEPNIDIAWKNLAEESARQSAQYDQYCLETGDDPLGAYYVKRTNKKRRNWIIYWNTWIGADIHGLSVKSGRGPKSEGKNVRGIYKPADFPDYLRDFLELKKVGDRYCMDGIHSKEDMTEAGCVGNGYAKLAVDFETPRSAATIRKEIREIARAAIARAGGG